MQGNDGYLYLLDQETPYIWKKFTQEEFHSGWDFTINLLDGQSSFIKAHPITCSTAFSSNTQHSFACLLLSAVLSFRAQHCTSLVIGLDYATEMLGLVIGLDYATALLLGSTLHSFYCVAYCLCCFVLPRGRHFSGLEKCLIGSLFLPNFSTELNFILVTQITCYVTLDLILVTQITCYWAQHCTSVLVDTNPIQHYQKLLAQAHMLLKPEC